MAEVKVAPWQLVLPFDNLSTLLASNQLVIAETLALVEAHAASADPLSVTYDVVFAAATSLLVFQASGLLMLRILLVGAPSTGKTEAALFIKNQPDVYHPDTGVKVLR